MVLSVATPDLSTSPQVSPGANGAAEPRTNPIVAEPTNGTLPCQRCGAKLVMGYYEPQCMCCGYVDYSYTPQSPPREDRCIISTATRYVLRYVGDFPTLTETLTHVRLVRVRNRVVFDVDCPFCDKNMDESSLSGKRPEVREQRYKCLDGHRVSLVPGKRGMLGWR